MKCYEIMTLCPETPKSVKSLARFLTWATDCLLELSQPLPVRYAPFRVLMEMACASGYRD